ncbi:unnamed protein product [Microthlaspi erraticum]|uniref:DC1 domain-containing protein n=1 Tax=Microthlaspi erraticum TaxID=1685480 RepID=A0A6D2KTI6_9BRAS|nr:unnamed protein product [Microthlaspi erraticum]
MDSDSESKLLSLISQLIHVYNNIDDMDWDWDSKVESLIIQIISFISSMDLDSQLKPESKLMSLTTQVISVLTSMDLDSQPKPLSELISLISQNISINLESEPKSDWDFMALLEETMMLTPRPKLSSLILQILSLVISMDSKWKNLISLSPQVQVRLEGGSFHVLDEVVFRSNNIWECLPKYWEEFRSKEKITTHFFCKGCKGEDHQEYEKAPLEIKHPLHPKHSLQLVKSEWCGTKKCYCCDEFLTKIFYYCSACDYAMNITCVEKPLVLSIDHQKWHEHDLALFPRKASLTCDLCALADSSCPFYICPPCDFVAHQSCLSLPRVIRISRHHHRISFTSSFDQEDRSCGVCRKEINNEYGSYYCTEKGCSYAAHSRCATQSNVWDGKDLENVPEEVEEELEPFVRISSGIIQHFSHQHHHMRLDEDTNREYDDEKQCQACITPIYFGNFYSCMQCDFILHEDCANLSRKIHHPIHPHLVTLVGGYEGVMEYLVDRCSACSSWCKTGFYYECGTKECDFLLHVQCATTSEPLVHGSHIHPLFLTSKPEEQRPCSVCEDSTW